MGIREGDYMISDDLMAVVIIEMQKAYIKELEQEVNDLKEALKVVNQNKVSVRKVRVCGRSKMDKNSNRFI